MKLFTSFFLYLLIGLALYFLLALAKKRSALPSRLFFLIAPAVTLLQTVLGMTVKGHPIWLGDVFITLKWIGWACLILLGYGLGYMIGERKDEKANQNNNWLMRGLSLQLGISFIASGIGQYQELPDIQKWFISSGYSVGFMHVIILIQIIAGALLLFKLSYKVRMATVTLLLAVMIGAVITHIHRGDAFAIAISATVLAIKCMLLLSTTKSTFAGCY